MLKEVAQDYYVTHRTILNNDIKEDYEFGITATPEIKKAYHYGTYMGYRTVFQTDYERNISIIVLSNSDLCSYSLRKQIVNQL